jgi:hypothetical protein
VSEKRYSFSLMGGLVPIFGPSARAGCCCNPHGAPMSERSLLMLPLANLMPCLPGLGGMEGSFKTYAPSPVWRDETVQKLGGEQNR